MKKKLIGIIVCMLLITNILYFSAIAVDEKTDYNLNISIDFIFVVGRIKDLSEKIR
ncbi:MAG: hypothetical protein JSW60_07785 [Thermoplasmatales archaeon]|nr:MAG: hypothetical protein JSW60_07785 [Thermoplasmatales archaeon]